MGKAPEEVRMGYRCSSPGERRVYLGCAKSEIHRQKKTMGEAEETRRRPASAHKKRRSQESSWGGVGGGGGGGGVWCRRVRDQKKKKGKTHCDRKKGEFECNRSPRLWGSELRQGVE